MSVIVYYCLLGTELFTSAPSSAVLTNQLLILMLSLTHEGCVFNLSCFLHQQRRFKSYVLAHVYLFMWYILTGFFFFHFFFPKLIDWIAWMVGHHLRTNPLNFGRKQILGRHSTYLIVNILLSIVEVAFSGVWWQPCHLNRMTPPEPIKHREGFFALYPGVSWSVLLTSMTGYPNGKWTKPSGYRSF